jgi:hypothetical protein
MSALPHLGMAQKADLVRMNTTGNRTFGATGTFPPSSRVTVTFGALRLSLEFGLSDSQIKVRAKSGVPFQLSHMVVLETAKGARVLIRSDAVRMIEEVEDSV